MKTAVSKSLIALSVIAAITTPILANAESSTQTGAGALTANARLDFRITIPKVLFLRVGTGGLFGAAANATIDLIDFTVPVANLGDGTPIAATLASGNLGSGAVTALLRSNAGVVTLTANTTGALTNATTDTIPWSEIGIANSALVAPAFANTFPHIAALPLTGASANFAPAPVAKVTNVGSTWTFSYLNTGTYPAGIYGPTANGRVTYTASVL
ncbi:MAG: hypothetical protein IPP88_12555 [Betaproteobacteria bacterium]|jgi:hypothetical protein|nr:hypothetical protein [Betaproteobacteria bacterium]